MSNDAQGLLAAGKQYYCGWKDGKHICKWEHPAVIEQLNPGFVNCSPMSQEEFLAYLEKEGQLK